MNETSKKYRLTIFGDSYSIVSDEAEEIVVSCAQQVDTLMREIARGSQIAEAKRVAVLAALKLAAEISEREESLMQYRSEQRKLIDLLDRELS